MQLSIEVPENLAYQLKAVTNSNEFIIKTLQTALETKQDAVYQVTNPQSFTVRQFHLGEELSFKREELYRDDKDNVCN